MIIEQIIGALGSWDDHLDDWVDLKIDMFWYRCKVRNLPDAEHLLSVHPLDKDGKINCRFDTGRCGPEALADDVRPAGAWLHGIGVVPWPKDCQDAEIMLRWDPEIGNDGTRLFYGGFVFTSPAKEV